MHQHVAIGVGMRYVNHLHGFTIEGEIKQLARKSIVGHCSGRQIFNLCHAIQHTGCGNDGGTSSLTTACADVARHIAANHLTAGRAQACVTTDMVIMNMRVEYVANGLVARDAGDFCNERIRACSKLRIDHQHAGITHLHGDVAALADDHPDVAGHVH